MEKKSLYLYNSLSRKVELFTPITEGFVGMYVCGPTVYGDGHLGHARPAITYDILFRLLLHLGYSVRYVRNITDVGHLENEIESEGEDKISKRAKIEQLEPMEIANNYTRRYRQTMERLGVLPPSIEPLASGHIIEQIELTQQILDKGLAYQVNGSVYFDVRRYSQTHQYGQLSGRNLDDIVSGSRELDGQSEKRFSADFALWKNASQGHIMRWNSPFGVGFPGWHAECTAMSAKYLGARFDIHGGGMDLLFPHHECEIAQGVALNGHIPATYWIHNNMITIDGQKMGKSLGNFITLDEFFEGRHPLLTSSYSPMVIRFFILTAHYRSTLDFSDTALNAAQKGYQRLMRCWDLLRSGAGDLSADEAQNIAIKEPLYEACLGDLLDDMNTPRVIARLFDTTADINLWHLGEKSIDNRSLCAVFDVVLGQLLGLTNTKGVEGSVEGERLNAAMSLLLDVRKAAKLNRDFAASDSIRDKLTEAGFSIKDNKDGTTNWE